MPLTEQDKIEIREIARLLVKEVLKEHIDACPHGRAIIQFRYMVAGLLVGTTVASFAGSSVAITLAKLLLVN
jgi:ribonuclease PH